ncbi:4-hydroxy-3-methylbut-2-enyl diphosphate reductase [Candidatus Venteria ishoeyi]|uniref:4-hydroxy-3-methylbut-2-enyl diphosphate reductase n=1 Tax=Candidatus Venteria ishoeyi TaxID=1899563 RepID=UPI0025A646F9|nr:4-hydroxy-3-methylbut-2-enyl diphosphate reductase [Candidatus Venteria ishoeyi]MDM8545235.1 4-hydroxy-3-methylbut-2-enyl diphosphate reductase [Candidatus Venteria ishoeyi]
MIPEIILAQPRGFCAGVVRAIKIVEQALEKHGAPVYVFHEIVHNRHVVEDLRQRGAIFVEDINIVPQGALCIFSAHGVPRKVVMDAAQRQLHAIDATCPLVTKVHHQAQRYQKQGLSVVIVGHAGHPEVEGTCGQLDDPVHVLCSVAEVEQLQPADPEKLAYVTQTTLSVDDTQDVISALQQYFPKIQGPSLKDICYATQNRQNAVRELATDIDLLLVVGGHNSSNSNRLMELGRQVGIASELIEDADDIQPQWFKHETKVGITAGASAPEDLVQGVIQRLSQLGIKQVHEMHGIQENTTFKLPEIL